MPTERVFAAIDGLKDEMVGLQTLLCSKPAIAPDSGGQGEWDKALALEAWLKERGLGDIEWHPAPDSRVPGGLRPNLVLSLAGQKEASLWIMSHLDVVPPGEASLWDGDPWVCRRDGDYIYGRGVEDNQQGLCSSVAAVMALSSLGVRPRLGVKLLMVADEEVGSAYGIDWLLKNRSLFGPEDLVLIPDTGTPRGDEIEVAEKNLLWLKVRCRGRQCHGSVPDEGANAFLANCELALRLNELEVAHYIGRDHLFQPDRSTISPTKKEANVPNVNTIPGEDVFYLDCRMLPEYALGGVLEDFRQVAASIGQRRSVRFEFEVVQRVESRPTSPESAIVRQLTAAIQRVRGCQARAVGIGGGTVAAYLRNAGLNCAVWSTLEERAHQPNESCKLSNLIADAKVMALLAGLE